MNGQSELLRKPKLLIYWWDLVETLEEGHYILLVEAGQEETEEETVGQVHLEEQEACAEETFAKEVVEQAQRLELLAVMGLESSGMVHCSLARVLFLCYTFFLLF